MTSLTKAVCGSVSVLGLALVLAGCGGPDNESTMMKSTDGTSTKIEGGAGNAPTANNYNEMMKKSAESGSETLQKGYKKK